MPSTNELISQLYAGYFNRAPDPTGLAYWVGRGADGMTLTQIAQSFSVQPEATALYGFLSTPTPDGQAAFLNAVYTNLFNRLPDAAGQAYWTGQLSNSSIPVGRVLGDILSGAQGNDALIVTNKGNVGAFFASQFGANNTPFTLALARSVLATVDETSASVVNAVATVNTTITPPPPPPGALTFTGTGAVDTFTGGDLNDTFIGNGGADVLSGGGGNDVFKITGTAQLAAAGAIIPLIDGGAGTDDIELGNAAVTLAVGDSLARITNIERITSVANANVISLTFHDNVTATGLTTIDLSGDTDAAGANVVDLSNDVTGPTAIAVTGSAGVDTITGNGAANVINGGAGADIITGGGGADNLSGGDGADTFKFVRANLAAATVAGGNGTDIVEITAAALDIVDADFTNFTTVEVLKLTGASTLTVGALAAAAGLATINTGAGATTVNTSSTNAITIDAASLADGVALTLTDTAVVTNMTVTNLIGDIAAPTLNGTLSVTTAAIANVAIQTGAGATTIAGAATATSVNATALADGVALNLSGASNFTVTGLIGDVTFANDASGNQSVTVAAVPTVTVAFGTNTTGTHTVNANALTDGQVLTLTGSDVASVTLVGGDLTAGAYAGDLTVTATTGTNVITTGGGADTITGGTGADTITAGEGTDTVTIGNGQDIVSLAEAGAVADTVIYSTAFAAGNANAATITGFANGAGADTFDIGFALNHNTLNFAAGTGATNTIAASAPVTVANNGTTTFDTGVVFLLSGVDDQMAVSDVTNAVANAVTAMTSNADFAAANVATADSLIVVLDDGTNSFVFHYVADATAPTTSAADLELIGIINGVADAGTFTTGDFI